MLRIYLARYSIDIGTKRVFDTVGNALLTRFSSYFLKPGPQGAMHATLSTLHNILIFQPRPSRSARPVVGKLL